MELVDGDAQSPTLISNVEVMQILKKNLDERARNSNSKKKNTKRSKQLRHRDWVEEEVHKYLESTPCVKLDPDKREEFHSKLKGNKKLRKASKKSNVKKKDDQKESSPEGSATGFDLTEAEALQIMNMMPTEPVEIHLMVDELSSRMSEEKQEEFLEFIKSYSNGSSPKAPVPASATLPKAVNGQHENGKKPAASASATAPAVKVKQEETHETPNNIL